MTIVIFLNPISFMSRSAMNRLKKFDRHSQNSPAARRKRFITDYDISAENAEFLTATRHLAEFFDEAAKLSGEPTTCANWIMGDLTRLLNTAEIEIQDSKVTPAHLNESHPTD